MSTQIHNLTTSLCCCRHACAYLSVSFHALFYCKHKASGKDQWCKLNFQSTIKFATINGDPQLHLHCSFSIHCWFNLIWLKRFNIPEQHKGYTRHPAGGRLWINLDHLWLFNTHLKLEKLVFLCYICIGIWSLVPDIGFSCNLMLSRMP